MNMWLGLFSFFFYDKNSMTLIKTENIVIFRVFLCESIQTNFGQNYLHLLKMKLVILSFLTGMFWLFHFADTLNSELIFKEVVPSPMPEVLNCFVEASKLKILRIHPRQLFSAFAVCMSLGTAWQLCNKFDGHEYLFYSSAL